jgi:hypothetical protein
VFEDDLSAQEDALAKIAAFVFLGCGKRAGVHGQLFTEQRDGATIHALESL